MKEADKTKVNIALLVALMVTLGVAMVLRFYLPMACLSFATILWLFLGGVS